MDAETIASEALEKLDRPPEPIKITDVELDAATDAYVRQRWPNVEEWRERFPEAWRDTRIKMHAALMAAAIVRERG